jgi:hypothetical protein
MDVLQSGLPGGTPEYFFFSHFDFLKKSTDGAHVWLAPPDNIYVLKVYLTTL